MNVKDERKELSLEDRQKYCDLVACTDRVLSGTSFANYLGSYMVFCCRPNDSYKVQKWLENRQDPMRIRRVSTNYRPHSNYCGQVSYYIVDENHPALI